MKGVNPMYDEKEKMNVERRITTLEVVIGELKSDIGELAHKLDEIKTLFRKRLFGQAYRRQVFTANW